MDWKKSIGYGAGLYVVMFMYWSLLVAFGQGEAVWGWYVGFVVTAAAAYYAAKKLETRDWRKLIKYSVVWVVVMAALDALISIRFAEAGLFSSWELYVGYGILLLAPLTVACCKSCGMCTENSPADAVETIEEVTEI